MVNLAEARKKYLGNNDDDKPRFHPSGTWLGHITSDPIVGNNSRPFQGDLTPIREIGRASIGISTAQVRGQAPIGGRAPLRGGQEPVLEQVPVGVRTPVGGRALVGGQVSFRVRAPV